jgi:hypothetical protein
MKKEKKVAMPEIKNKNKWWSGIKLPLVLISVGAIIFLSLLGFIGYQANKTEELTKCVKKGEVTNYVCKVVGAEPEENVVAVQCFTK